MRTVKHWLPLASGILFAALVVGGIASVRSAIGGTSQPSATTYRWGSVTIDLPSSDSHLYVGRTAPVSEGQPFVIEVIAETDEHQRDVRRIRIDAMSGAVIFNTLSDYDAGAADSIVESIKMLETEPSEWPYDADGSPTHLDHAWGNLRYALPSSESGIVVEQSIGTCRTRDDDRLDVCRSQSLFVYTPRSAMHIYADNGEVASLESVSEADRAAFERLVASMGVAPTSPIVEDASP